MNFNVYIPLPFTSRPSSPAAVHSTGIASYYPWSTTIRQRLIVISVGCLLATGFYLYGTVNEDYFSSSFGSSKPIEDVGEILLKVVPTEQMGWEPSPSSSDLGSFADQKYRLDFVSSDDYYQQLTDFVDLLPENLFAPLSDSIQDHQRGISTPPNPMIDHKIIHQTDKILEINKFTRKWQKLNRYDGWKLNFLDDTAAEQWVDSVFGGSVVETTWNFLHRGVLKADFLRYLLPLVQGGVYTDVDTWPIRRIEKWGLVGVEYLNISSSQGTNWLDLVQSPPEVIVGIDVDVHSHPAWMNEWPRPLGICQWTLSSSPFHPILLDASRRVVVRTNEVFNREKIEIEQLVESGLDEESARREVTHQRDDFISVLEWTGPGLFTDAVIAYIQARYDVSWYRLRDLKYPLRIGEILILPITGFSPGGESDFKAEGRNSVQANVVHDFRGSWKSEGS